MFVETRQDQQKMVLQSAIWLSSLPESYQREFLKTLAANLSEQTRIQLHKIFTNLVFTRERWRKIERFMEKKYHDNPSIMPKQMANIAMSSMKIKTSMAPKMIVIAQRVKDRLRKKTAYQIHALHKSVINIKSQEGSNDQ